jgi:hypothetical protein
MAQITLAVAVDITFKDTFEVAQEPLGHSRQGDKAVFVYPVVSANYID